MADFRIYYFRIPTSVFSISVSRFPYFRLPYFRLPSADFRRIDFFGAVLPGVGRCQLWMLACLLLPRIHDHPQAVSLASLCTRVDMLHDCSHVEGTVRSSRAHLDIPLLLLKGCFASFHTGSNCKQPGPAVATVETFLSTCIRNLSYRIPNHSSRALGSHRHQGCFQARCKSCTGLVHLPPAPCRCSRDAVKLNKGARASSSRSRRCGSLLDPTIRVEDADANQPKRCRFHCRPLA